MSRLKYLLSHFEEILISILLPAMVMIIFIGTAGRYSKLFLLPWAEELARYMMIWMVFLGIAAGARRNAHFVVEVMMLILPKALRKYLRIFTTLFVAAFMGILIYYSHTLLMRIKSMGQVSPSLSVPMWLIYAAIPVGCALMAVRTIQSCCTDLLARPAAGTPGGGAEEPAEIYE